MKVFITGGAGYIGIEGKGIDIIYQVKKIISVIYGKNLKILLALIILIAEGSCKKGEKDPFFSFRSRKNRITGTWKYQTFIRNGKPNMSSFEEKVLYDEYCDADANVSLQTDQKINLELKDDHQFILSTITAYDYEVDYIEFTNCRDEEQKFKTLGTETGEWEFEEKKSHLVLLYEDSLNTREKYEIIGLKKDELTLKGINGGNLDEIYAVK